MNVTVPYIGRELTVKVGALFYILYEQGRSLQVQSIIKLWEQKLFNSVNHYNREILIRYQK